MSEDRLDEQQIWTRRRLLTSGAAASLGAVVGSGLLRPRGAGALTEAALSPLVNGDGQAGGESTFRTFVLVIDGLFPDLVRPDLMPNLWRLTQGKGGNATTYTRAQAGMTSTTNANHVMMMTGLPGSEHGIVGNDFYNRARGEIEGLDRPELILDNHLFDAVEAQKPWLTTAAVLGKGKLRELFDCTRDEDGNCGPSSDNPEGQQVEHAAPDFVPEVTSLDNLVMREVIELRRTEDPSFVFVNLPDVDQNQHTYGARSPGGLYAVRNVDEQIGLLVDDLQRAGVWDRSLLIVTADHCFAELDGTGDAVDVGPTRMPNPAARLVTGSRVVLEDHLDHPGIEAMVTHGPGGSASIYLADPDDRDLAAQLAQRALAVTDPLGRPAVADAFCRLPASGSERIPRTWGLDTERIGEVLLVSDGEHYFTTDQLDGDGYLPGHHGGPPSLPVPLILASGSPQVLTTEVSRPVTVRDIAPTVAWVHGLTGRGNQPFPGRPKWSEPLLDAFAQHPAPSASGAKRVTSGA